MIDEAYAKGREILNANRDKLKLLAEALMERETIDGREAEALIGIERAPKEDAAE